MKSLPAFSEERLPDDIALAASGGAEYSTSILTTICGHEQRNVNWLQARARYDLAPALKNSQQLETLISFFRAHKGRGIGFRFRDWADYNAYHELIALGDGVTTCFQLCKSYRSGGCTDVRFITKPCANSVQVFVDAHPLEFTCDYTTGVITCMQPPAIASKITASFEYDIPVRFDSDFLDLELAHQGRISIPIIEIKV